MTKDSNPTPGFIQNQAFWWRLVSVILWSGLFALAYAQSPLYTSNQNQYFLQGLAKAGYGDLSLDWLANTTDPTPVFSGLVYLTYRLIHWQPIFYLYYGVLAGVYLFSTYGILSTVFQEKVSRSRRWLTLVVLILVQSAGLRTMLVRVLSPDWAYLFDGGVAGQRLLGSVLQPSAFGVLILLSIFLFLKHKPIWAVFALILVPTIHPTYLLTAASLTMVYMGLTFFEARNFRSPLVIGITAFLGVVPILIHTVSTFGGTHPNLLTRSRELLVSFRIPHHAIPAEWFDGSVVIKILLILIALYLTRKTRLFHILLWPFAIGLLGTLIQIITPNNALALLFPWRISTWLLPLAVGVVVFKSVEVIYPWFEKRIPTKTMLAASLVLSILLAGVGLTKSILEEREKSGSPDRPMMAYVSENKVPGDTYLIPLDMQDFRLETGAPVYVEFKSIPYKDVEVLEWYRRVSLAGNLYRAPRKRDGCAIAGELYLEGVTHVVLPYDHRIKNCENLVLGYADLSYEVYKIVGD
jgi:hypothetical protein